MLLKFQVLNTFPNLKNRSRPSVVRSFEFEYDLDFKKVLETLPFYSSLDTWRAIANTIPNLKKPSRPWLLLESASQ